MWKEEVPHWTDPPKIRHIHNFLTPGMALYLTDLLKLLAIKSKELPQRFLSINAF